MYQKIKLAYLTRKAAKVNAGRVTVAEYLRNLGADEDLIKRYGFAFGGKVNKLYQEKHGVKAPQTGAAAIMRAGKAFLVDTYAYRWDELSLLNEAALSYGPVRELVGA